MKHKKPEEKKNERLASLDTLRGFDMFWIIGGGSLILALAAATGWRWLGVVAEQMHHVPWQGYHWEDQIFPMFMFISGVAIPYAITSRIEKGENRYNLFTKAAKRGLILVLFGILYNGILERGFSNARLASVLGQIGLGYFFAATIVIYTNNFKERLYWLIGILAGIAILQLAVPVPMADGTGSIAGALNQTNGINAYLDRLLLPGRLHGQTFDPEGVLCTVSAITVTLMGALTGGILRDGTPASAKKSTILLITGVSLIVVALLLSTFYPIIKAAWTVPFNLLTSGISLVLLALFYYCIDVRKWTGGIAGKKILFFQVIGMNSITIYMGRRIVDFEDMSKFFTGWLEAPLGNWIVILGAIVLEWLVLYYLYKKKIFLKV